MNKKLKNIKTRRAELEAENSNAQAIADEMADLDVQEFGAIYEEMTATTQNAYAVDKSCRQIVAKKTGLIKIKVVSFENSPKEPSELLEMEIGHEDIHANPNIINNAIQKLGEMTTGVNANKVRKYESTNRNLLTKWRERPKTA